MEIDNQSSTGKNSIQYDYRSKEELLEATSVSVKAQVFFSTIA
jgi:hypothetical protein